MNARLLSRTILSYFRFFAGNIRRCTCASRQIQNEGFYPTKQLSARYDMLAAPSMYSVRDALRKGNTSLIGNRQRDSGKKYRTTHGDFYDQPFRVCGWPRCLPDCRIPLFLLFFREGYGGTKSLILNTQHHAMTAHAAFEPFKIRQQWTPNTEGGQLPFS